jgi:tetratricopeptide (TPR) repeat protein
VWTGVLRGLRRFAPPPEESWRELPKLVPELARGHHDATGTKYRLQQEISVYLRLAARSAPLVVVLDEMQWADEESWDALDYLLDHVSNEKLLVCLTMRGGDEYVTTRERCATYQHRPDYQELQLPRLTRDEVKRWLVAALDHQEVGREFLSFLYRHTEGNPFSLAQLVRCVADEGKLWHNGEQWEWKPVSELQLPAGLTGIVSRRIERFSLSTQAVLSAAAIVGHEVDVALVAASGAGSAPAVQLAFDEALAAGMLQPVYDRRSKASTFVHDSIMDVLAQSVSADRLRHLHERVAQAIEARGEGSAAELALHYDAASSNAAAYRTALDAALKAEALHAPVVASEYLHVAARNSSSPAELAEVRVRLAYIAGAMGRYDEEEELCDLAIEWFEGQGDRRRTLTLRRMRELARKELGQPAGQSMEALLALDQEAVALGFEQERVAILTLISQTHGRLGEAREAERVAATCVQIAEHVGHPPLLAEALIRLGITVESESPHRAREYHERALALAQASGDVRGQLRCYNNLGIVLQLEGRIDAARESLTMAISVGRAAGIADLWGAAALNLGVLMQNLGDYARARDLFSEALDLFTGLKNSEYQLLTLFNMAHVERERGQHASAADLYGATFSLAKRIGQSDVEIGARAGEGLCLLAQHRLAGARRAMAEAESLMVARREWFQGRELIETLGVLIAAAEGRGDDVLAQFERARALAEAAGFPRAADLTARCADALFAFDSEIARAAVARYSSRVPSLGFATLTERYRILDAKV